MATPHISAEKGDFAKTVLYCDKKCEKCSYCEKIMNDATIKLSDDPSVKV